MRITYLHQYFNTPAMSGGTRSYEMAKRMVEMGHTVNMITSWRSARADSGWKVSREAGIQVHWCNVPYSNNMSYARRVQAFAKFALKASIRARAIPADVIFATSTPLTIAVPGILAARSQRIPMVFEVRDLWPDLPIAMGALRNPIIRSVAKRLERLAYGNSAAVIALSPGMQAGVIRAGFPEERTIVIPNCADLDMFDNLDEPAQEFRQRNHFLGSSPLIVYAGTIGAMNGVDYLVRIAAAARQLKVRANFVVVGRGACEEQVRSEASKLGVLGDNFFMLPPVAKSEMRGVLGATDVALSLFIDIKEMWANSANKFFDALASATPVAINYGGWQADLVRQTGSGLVLPADDQEGAARALGALIMDRERLAAMSRAARAVAEQEFDRDVAANKLEKVLKRAASTYFEDVAR